MPLPIIAQVLLTAAPAIIGVVNSSKASKAAKKAGAEQKRQEQILRNLEANRQEVTNPYDNLAVATKAEEMAIEEVDQSLATALDTLQATGYGSGAATALARSANESKMKIISGIERQQVQNEKLKAQGEQFVFQTTENREMQKLNRVAGLADNAANQQMQYEADARAAMLGGITGSASMAASLFGGTGAKKTKSTGGGSDPQWQVVDGLTDRTGMINPVQIGVNAAGEAVYEDR